MWLKGVIINTNEAVKWYRKAAEQGNAGAQFNLGISYFKGEGVLRNDIESYAWLILAKFNGYESDKAIEILSSKMTNSDISNGQKRAQEIQNEIEGNL